MNKALFGQVSVLKILVIICSNLVIKVSSGKVEIEIRLVEIEDSVVEDDVEALNGVANAKGAVSES